jgi:D-tyrosyl-tRNA(Tyr) deacylase
MKAVIQRVNESSVKIDNQKVGQIKKGLLILLGIVAEDNNEDISWLVNKIINLRIFDDENGVMNLSVKEISGELLVVSQFTLHASTKKGNRPSYIYAAKPDIAIPLYEQFLIEMETSSGLNVQKGKFGADMQVELINNGPVTLIIDTKNKV